ncbi:MAG TPA: sigma-70 family RNA polymerase sigma factor, partial [Pseudonocardiaceae bacterium]|nr:sigma-70 family RNA polymerase sigma factor [Pseudonocardiaceae bacterium]
MQETISESVFDERCWHDIVCTYSARVYRLAYRLTGNPDDAADLTQDVFVRVFRSLPTFSTQKGTFGGWIYRITTNLFLDRVRREQRIRLEAFADSAGERLASRDPTPAQSVLNQTFN